MATFNPSEIYQFAIRIEENGEQFYTQMAEKYDNEKVQELFSLLAREEVGHKMVFSKILSGFEDYNPPESYTDEYFQYLKAYSDKLVFDFDNFDGEVAKINTIEEAFHFAIKKEIDTIAYFREMKNLVPEGEKDKIEDIIAEERKHVVFLTELKNELQN